MKLKLREWLLRDYNVPKSEEVKLITIFILTVLIASLAVGELLVDLKATSLQLILPLLGLNLILLVWVRYFRQSKFIGHAQLLILYVMFQLSFLTIPNTFHVLMYWMPSIPLLALIFGNLKSSYVWLLISIATLWIDVSYGINELGKEYTVGIPFLPYAFAGTIFMVTLVACFSILYNLLGKSYSRLRAKNREVVELIRQLKVMNGSLEGLVKERTQVIEERNQRLEQYAFMNSHLVRAPLANILGALNHLENEVNKSRKNELMELLKVSATNLDDVIKEVGKSLSER